MHRIGRSVLLWFFLGSVYLWPQQMPGSQTSESKIVAELNDELSQNMFDLRNRDAQEIPKLCVGYEEPNLARALLDPSSFIAIIAVTKVGLPEKNGYPPTPVGLRVEQFLRGSSEHKELQAANLVDLREARVHCGGGFGGAGFYFPDPKVGDRYLVGYSFFGGDTSTAYISGGIDLADHDKAHEMVDVKRFLDIEAIAGTSDSMPYVTALTDPVPWFRDLAAQRLVQSKACNNSPSCRQAFLSATRDLLRSSKYGDRQEALHWTRLLTEQMPGDRNEWGSNGVARSDGLSLMSTDAVRDMLRLAISDRYLYIVDQAYEQLELFDFYHSSPTPGDCIVIYRELRKSVRLPAAELKDMTVRGHSKCIPE